MKEEKIVRSGQNNQTKKQGYLQVGLLTKQVQVAYPISDKHPPYNNAIDVNDKCDRSRPYPQHRFYYLMIGLCNTIKWGKTGLGLYTKKYSKESIFCTRFDSIYQIFLSSYQPELDNYISILTAAQMVLKQDPRNIELCRYYIATMRTVAEKHVIRIHPSIKRTYCKKCNVILLSGKTCRIRSRSKSEKHTVVTCLLCGNIKRYMWRKNYCLWVDKTEAWLPDKKK
ncbi:Ribonuclease P protein subunit p21 [Bulinus truncatus]|nr:Ribonuclease P protein subunit p21 [Bulinus truncatus]